MTELELEVTDTSDVEDLLVDVDTITTLLELLDTIGPNLYISNLFPAPQYSYADPGQIKLQSA